MLYGQTVASANPEGIIHITDMLLRALPRTYILAVSLLDYSLSQVTLLSFQQLLDQVLAQAWTWLVNTCGATYLCPCLC